MGKKKETFCSRGRTARKKIKSLHGPLRSSISEMMNLFSVIIMIIIIMIIIVKIIIVIIVIIIIIIIIIIIMIIIITRRKLTIME